MAREFSGLQMRGVIEQQKWWVFVRRERLDSSTHHSTFCAPPSHWLLDRKTAGNAPPNTPIKRGQAGNGGKWRPLPVGERNQPSDDAWRERGKKWWGWVGRERLDSSIHRSSICASLSHCPTNRTSRPELKTIPFEGQMRERGPCQLARESSHLRKRGVGG